MDTISLLIEREILKEKVDNAEAFLEELIHYIFVVCEKDDYITPEVICRKLYKYGFIDKEDGEWVADTPQTEEQRKVQEAERRMANIIADMNPQTDCETCRHYKPTCELFSEICKYEPITQTKT